MLLAGFCLLGESPGPLGRGGEGFTGWDPWGNVEDSLALCRGKGLVYLEELNGDQPAVRVGFKY